jgi:hypothetical protein
MPQSVVRGWRVMMLMVYFVELRLTNTANHSTNDAGAVANADASHHRRMMNNADVPLR